MQITYSQKIINITKMENWGQWNVRRGDCCVLSKPQFLSFLGTSPDCLSQPHLHVDAPHDQELGQNTRCHLQAPPQKASCTIFPALSWSPTSNQMERTPRTQAEKKIRRSLGNSPQAHPTPPPPNSKLHNDLWLEWERSICIPLRC